MSRLLFGAVLPLLICVFVPKAAFLQQDIYCRDHLEYQHAGICCLNCPAGKRLVSPCKTAGTRGVCVECDDGTYTEHANSLRQCFKCTQCRRDQDIVRACSHTLDTECQCKPGKFCAPDQACEVCKKCTRCDQDEEIVRNCTPTANRECKKIQAKSVTPGVKASVIVLISLFAVAVLAVIVVLVWRHHRATGSRHLSEDLKAEKPFGDFHPTAEVWNGETHRPSCSSLILPRQLVRTKSSVHEEDERKVLCESLNSSASNSQHSLTGLTTYTFPATPPHASPLVPVHATGREDEQLPKLVAVNGEESLRKCFCYFEEIDVNYHKRFFRHLGISDNMIKGKENLPYEDRIHDLLNIWIEKAGKEADLNDLLQVLLDLNQRRTAEQIKEHAIHHGHYFSEEM